MSIRAIALCICLLTTFLATGCAVNSQPTTLYGWGHYETLLYKMHMKPGEATPPEQVNQLTQDVEKITASGQRVAPGIHAQLGYMAWLAGQPALAGQQFQAERTLYPESGPFMDRLLANLQKNTQ